MSPYDFSASPQNTEHTPKPEISVKEITEHCKAYKGGDAKAAIFQLVTTLTLLAGNIAAMIYAVNVSYWIVAALTLPAAGLLTRVFIFQHDCGHGSFFKSKAANTWIGRFMGILTFTPYDFWRRAHNMHHATSGNLDSRSIGAVDTITVEEYNALPKTRQRAYRIYRNPLFLIFIGTPLYVLIAQRIPFKQTTNFFDHYKTISSTSIRASILLNNVAMLAFYGAAVAAFGWVFLAVYIPVVVVTSWIGGWLFYVQHQFEDTYWERKDEWDIFEAGLMGSSYYKMPRWMQWFSGNIGLHHIHHLCAQIPNYKLQECMDTRPELAEINTLGLRESLSCAKFQLWDEKAGEMVSVPRS